MDLEPHHIVPLGLDGEGAAVVAGGRARGRIHSEARVGLTAQQHAHPAIVQAQQHLLLPLLVGEEGRDGEAGGAAEGDAGAVAQLQNATTAAFHDIALSDGRAAAQGLVHIPLSDADFAFQGPDHGIAFRRLALVGFIVPWRLTGGLRSDAEEGGRQQQGRGITGMGEGRVHGASAGLDADSHRVGSRVTEPGSCQFGNPDSFQCFNLWERGPGPCPAWGLRHGGPGRPAAAEGPSTGPTTGAGLPFPHPRRPPRGGRGGT